MLYRGRKGKSGPRSNLHSQVKAANGRSFNPFYAEADLAVRRLAPAAHFPLGDDARLPLFVARPDRHFIQPVTTGDVAGVLSSIPIRLLSGLAGIYLLGGNTSQDRLGESRLACYGCYGECRIWLFAVPRRLLARPLPHPHKPSIRQMYERMGAVYRHGDAGLQLVFDERSLRRFYLHDVLLHEIGHHVERHRERAPSLQSERYATWFAEALHRAL